MNRKGLTLLVGIVILCFVCVPGVVCRGAASGLLLWYEKVLPSLTPFMILSDFMLRQGITEGVSSIAAPAFTRIFGISRTGCYPAVIGFLSGYPVGAKTAAGLYERGQLTREEAQYLLCFCNNASPMFLLQYVGSSCMGLAHPLLVPAVIYLSAWVGASVSREKRALRRAKKKLAPVRRDTSDENGTFQKKSIIVSLDESILDASVTITKVGGYIMLFSILAQLADRFLPMPDFFRYIGIGILEITTGGEALSGTLGRPFVRNVALTGLCAFGGLSSAAQTASVLAGTDLSNGKYLLAKLRQSGIAIIISILIFR